jgi:outer membrane protein assembly factor BamE
MRKILLISLITILLFGCSKLRPYHVCVQQGNILDQDTMEQLHLGLNKTQVRSILGTPLMDDNLDTNTWTYVYTNQVDDRKIEKKNLTLTFKRNRLTRISQ